MKRLLLSLLAFASISAIGQTLSRSCTFDFSKPNTGGLSQNITPSTTNGGDVDVTGIVFQSQDITLTTVKDESAISRGARIFSYQNPISLNWEYSLLVYNAVALVFEGLNGATIQSIQFGDGSSMGGLQIESSQAGKGTFSNVDMKWTASVSGVDYLEIKNKQSTRAKINTITVNYYMPSEILEPSNESITDGDEVASFKDLVLAYSEELSIATTEGITISYNGEVVSSSVSISGGTVTIAADEKITEDGTVTINIPAGCFKNSTGYSNTAKTYTLTVKEPLNSFTYESYQYEGETIDTLSDGFTVTFPDIIGDLSTEWQIIKNSEGKGVSVVMPEIASDDKKQIKFLYANNNDPITEEGTYTLTIPEKAVYNKFKGTSEERWNPEIVLTYTIGTKSEPVEDSETMTKAKSLLSNTGVGYPTTTSDGYVALLAKVNGNASDEELVAALDTYYKETSVNMPSDGSYYTIAGINKSGDKLYLYYDGESVSLTSEEANATSFLATVNSDGTTVFSTVDGKYLHVLSSNDGYDQTSSKNLTETKGDVNNLTLSKLNDNTNLEGALGKMTMYGLLGKTVGSLNAENEYSYVIIGYPGGTIYKGTLSDVTFTDDLSSAFVLENAEKPDGSDTPTGEIELTYELSQSRDSNGNLILSLVFTDSDVTVTSKNTAGEYIQDANGGQTIIAVTQESLTANTFTVNLGNLSNGTYTLIIPNKNLVCTKDGSTMYVSQISEEFVVKGSSSDATGVDFDQSYNQYFTVLDPKSVHYDTDLNNFIIYNYVSTLYDDMVPSSNVVKLTRTDDASDVIREGVFERYEGTDLPEGTVGLKLKFTDGKGDITRGELKADRYTFIIPVATWGDGNFALYLSGDSSIEASSCKVNKFSLNTFIIDNESASGIYAVSQDSDKVQVIYDLFGRRLNQIDKPGIYIVNGKKVIKKSF